MYKIFWFLIFIILILIGCDGLHNDLSINTIESYSSSTFDLSSSSSIFNYSSSSNDTIIHIDELPDEPYTYW